MLAETEKKGKRWLSHIYAKNIIYWLWLYIISIIIICLEHVVDRSYMYIIQVKYNNCFPRQPMILYNYYHLDWVNVCIGNATLA